MPSPEIGGSNVERTPAVIALLDELKMTAQGLREDGPDTTGERARRIAETNKSLDTLHRAIEAQLPSVLNWSEEQMMALAAKAREVESALPENAPRWLQELVSNVRHGTEQLLVQKRTDPGPGLKSVERTADVVGGRVAPIVGGAALGTSAAVSAGLTGALATTATIAGAVGGGVAVPIVVETLANRIQDPKVRSILKTVVYTGIGAATAVLAPSALVPLAVALGISGIINLTAWLSSSPSPAAQAQAKNLKEAQAMAA